MRILYDKLSKQCVMSDCLYINILHNKVIEDNSDTVCPLLHKNLNITFDSCNALLLISCFMIAMHHLNVVCHTMEEWRGYK